jgi:hypothetical protein
MKYLMVYWDGQISLGKNGKLDVFLNNQYPDKLSPMHTLFGCILIASLDNDCFLDSPFNKVMQISRFF